MAATHSAESTRSGWRRLDPAAATAGLLAGPLLWLLLFFVIPVAFVAAYSVGAVELFPTDTGVVSLASWQRLLTGGSVYMGLFWKSVRISLMVSSRSCCSRIRSGTSWPCASHAQVRAAAADHRAVLHELPASRARVGSSSAVLAWSTRCRSTAPPGPDHPIT